MALLQPVLYTILQLIILAGIGFMLKRFAGWPEEFFRRLSRFLVTYALPLYLFTAIANTHVEALRGAKLFPLLGIALIAVGLAVSVPLFTIFRFQGGDRRAGIALATFGNSAYLPLSVMAIFQLTAPRFADRFGGQAPSLFVGALLLTFSPLLWSAGNLILTRRERGIRAAQIITPPVIGVVAGFLVVISGASRTVMNPTLPLFPIFRSLEMLGNVTFPMILVSLGAMIADLRFGSNVRGKTVAMAALVTSVRFLVLPAIFIALFFVLRLSRYMSPAQLWVLFLEVTSPPATNLSVMARSARVNENNTAFTLLVTYVVYMIVLPFELYLFLSLPGIMPAGAI